MVTILILTHNRPELFKQCINSVISNKHFNNIQVIVNNDSSDIQEICHDNIKYFYSKLQVNDIYKFLYDQAQTDYIMYLEDDDTLLNIDNIMKNLHLADLHIGLYLPYVSLRKVYQFEEQIRNIKNKTFNYRYFQLSQMIFKKSMVSKFPSQYDNENDEKLLSNILSNNPLTEYYKDFIFKQGVDGNNLSLEYIIGD